jgi:CBS-domain-containing membrane protein
MIKVKNIQGRLATSTERRDVKNKNEEDRRLSSVSQDTEKFIIVHRSVKSVLTSNHTEKLVSFLARERNSVYHLIHVLKSSGPRL